MRSTQLSLMTCWLVTLALGLTSASSEAEPTETGTTGAESVDLAGIDALSQSSTGSNPSRRLAEELEEERKAIELEMAGLWDNDSSLKRTADQAAKTVRLSVSNWNRRFKTRQAALITKLQRLEARFEPDAPLEVLDPLLKDVAEAIWALSSQTPLSSAADEQVSAHGLSSEALESLRRLQVEQLEKSNQQSQVFIQRLQTLSQSVLQQRAEWFAHMPIYRRWLRFASLKAELMFMRVSVSRWLMWSGPTTVEGPAPRRDAEVFPAEGPAQQTDMGAPLSTPLLILGFLVFPLLAGALGWLIFRGLPSVWSPISRSIRAAAEKRRLQDAFLDSLVEYFDKTLLPAAIPLAGFRVLRASFAPEDTFQRVFFEGAELFMLLLFAISSIVFILRDEIATQSAASRELATLKVQGRTAALVVPVVAAKMGLNLIEAITLKGALYGFVLILVLFVLTAAVFVLASRNQKSIEGIIATRFQAQMASLGEVLANRALRLPLSIVGLGLYVAKSMVDAVSEFALRFRGVRGVIGGLFRPDASQSGQAPEPLPEELKQSFLAPPENDAQVIDYFPHLDALCQRIRHFAADTSGMVVAVVGDAGVGKTTWLEQLKRQCSEYPVSLVRFKHRFFTEEELIQFFDKALSDTDLKTEDQMVALLNNGPKRIILIDQAEYLILRALGGAEVFQSMRRIWHRTSNNVFWVVGCGHLAWRHLHHRFHGRLLFHETIELRPWSHRALETLIESRMRRSKLSANFQDVAAPGADMTRAAERFRNLLFDDANGVARAAMHDWLKAVSYESEGMVRVRGVGPPKQRDELDKLGGEAKFLIASVLMHRSLTLEEAVSSVGYATDYTESILTFLVRQGFLHLRGSAYHINHEVEQTVTRYLDRANLLPK